MTMIPAFRQARACGAEPVAAGGTLVRAVVAFTVAVALVVAGIVALVVAGIVAFVVAEVVAGCVGVELPSETNVVIGEKVSRIGGILQGEILPRAAAALL